MLGGLPLAGSAMGRCIGLHVDGFSIVHAGFACLETVERLLHVCRDAFDGDSEGVRARSSRGHVYAARNLIESIPEVSTIWRCESLMRFLGDQLGDQFGLVRVLFFDKPPDRTWALPWHKDTVSTSKFLSLILRHQPDAIGMQLDAEGWLPIDELLENANRRGKSITLELLYEVVATNDKKRFALSNDGLRIRASQGHSVRTVELNLEPVEPPEFLYHGTVAVFIDSIRQQGLQKRSRNHVHLSPDKETAMKVGSRRGKPIILTVQVSRMHELGHEFFLSANGVWLTNAVPTEFIAFECTFEK